jgi:hypothetical protein
MKFIIFPLALVLLIAELSLIPNLPLGLSFLDLTMLLAFITTIISPALGISLSLMLGIVLQVYSSRIVFLPLISFLFPLVILLIVNRSFAFFSAFHLPSYPFLILSTLGVVVAHSSFLSWPFYKEMVLSIIFECVWSVLIILSVFYFIRRQYGQKRL